MPLARAAASAYYDSRKARGFERASDEAVIAFANRTYGPARAGCVDAVNRILERARLPQRQQVPSPMLRRRP